MLSMMVVMPVPMIMMMTMVMTVRASASTPASASMAMPTMPPWTMISMPTSSRAHETPWWRRPHSLPSNKVPYTARNSGRGRYVDVRVSVRIHEIMYLESGVRAFLNQEPFHGY